MKPLKYGFAKQARQHIKARNYFTTFKVSAVNIFDKQKTQMIHLTHLSHSGSVHGQNYSKICKK